MTDRQKQLVRFSEEFEIILKRHHPEAIAIFASVMRRLKQFNLHLQYDAYHILSEVFVRGIAYIEKGNCIQNPHAFIRFVSLRVIQELSRDRQQRLTRFEPMDSHRAEQSLTTPDVAMALVSDADLQEWMDRFRRSLPMMSVRDQEILRLRYVEGLSWDEVTLRLGAASGAKQSVATVRQAGHRAVNRLRSLMRAA